MKLDEMKVQYDRARDGFTKETAFAVTSEKKLPKVDVSGIAVKVGLCAGVLALAFIVRAFGVGAPKEQVVETSSYGDSAESNNDTPGRLKYVDASGAKWSAPVKAYDIELMLEGSMLRFTAGASAVSSCMDGSVHSVGTDETYGAFVRVQSQNDVEVVYYGLDEIAVTEGASVAAGDVLGTVGVGHSMYMKVFENGAPVDPSQYVDLSLGGE